MFIKGLLQIATAIFLCFRIFITQKMKWFFILFNFRETSCFFIESVIHAVIINF